MKGFHYSSYSFLLLSLFHKRDKDISSFSFFFFLLFLVFFLSDLSFFQGRLFYWPKTILKTHKKLFLLFYLRSFSFPFLFLSCQLSNPHQNKCPYSFILIQREALNLRNLSVALETLFNFPPNTEELLVFYSALQSGLRTFDLCQTSQIS